MKFAFVEGAINFVVNVLGNRIKIFAQTVKRNFQIGAGIVIALWKVGIEVEHATKFF